MGLTVKLFSKMETAFDHNGVCLLDPSVCTVSEESGGSYELYLEHPFDSTGKYLLIAEDMIIEAPVPHTVIPQITLPERTIYTVATVSEFYQKLPVTKLKKSEKSEIDTVREEYATNPTKYDYYPSKGFAPGAYCVFNGGIYKNNGTGVLMSVTPGVGDAWTWVAPLSGSTSDPDNVDYTPGVEYSPGLTQGATVYELGEYNKEYVQIRDLLGRVGYYKKDNLTEVTTEAETIPQQTIDSQRFRIYCIETEEETHILKVYARHISYDFSGNALMDCQVKKTKVQDALAVLQGSLMIPDTRRIVCQFKNTKITKDWSFKNPINALLDPDDGLVPELNAKLIRNNEDIFILKNNNPRKGPEIRYGMNMKGVNWKKNTESVVSRVVPRCSKGNDGYLYLEHGGTWNASGEWQQNNDIYVDAKQASTRFAYPKIEVMDCEYRVGEKYTPAGSASEVTMTESRCRTEMLADAQKRFEEDHCDETEYTLVVEFLLIGDSEQYKQYKGLQRVNLYDEIPIVTEMSSATAQVAAYEFDSLALRYNSITIGKVNSFNDRVAGYRVVKESITYSKLSPDLISRISTMNAPSGASTGASSSVEPSGGTSVIIDVVDNLTSSSTDSALSANQGKVLKDLIDSLGLAKLNKFTGNIDSTTIDPGVYCLEAANSYTHASLSDAPAYCTFIQLKPMTTQIIIQGDFILFRKRSGTPLAWWSWYKISGTVL